MKKEKSPVAEYMKIRRYMLNFVEQAGEKSVQAPTILELSRKFGVSRPTVSKAMKMLTDDGYIIGRPGLGAFTNPAKINRLQVTKYKNVALIVGDGMMVHFEPYNLELLGRIGIGIARRNFKLTLIQLPISRRKPRMRLRQPPATFCSGSLRRRSSSRQSDSCGREENESLFW